MTDLTAINWPVVQTEEIAAPERGSIVSGPFGSAISSKYFEEVGTPVIRGNNLTLGVTRFVDEGFVFLGPEKTHQFRNMTAVAGDIVFTAAGTLGQVGIIPERSRFPAYIISNKQLRLRVNRAKIDPSFAYYWYSSPALRQQIIASNRGSSVPLITLQVLRSLPIAVPPLDSQRRISSFLASYDDLIENNTRRIAVLEEMARRMFEEWFVKFHAPECRDMPLTDGPIGPVPQGWRVVTLGEGLAELQSGSRPKGGIREVSDGLPSIGAENINGLGRYDYSKERLIPRAFFETMRRGKVRSGDVMLYKDGAHIGRKALFRDNYPYAECAINEHVFALRPRAPFTSAFLYFWLDLPELTNRIKQLNSNAAQPGVNQVGVNGLPLLKPPDRIV